MLFRSEEVERINIKLAVLGEKIDGLVVDRVKVEALDDAIQELRIFQAQMKVWGVVAGGIWSLVLTLISIKVWVT